MEWGRWNGNRTSMGNVEWNGDGGMGTELAWETWNGIQPVMTLEWDQVHTYGCFDSACLSF